VSLSYPNETNLDTVRAESTVNGTYQIDNLPPGEVEVEACLPVEGFLAPNRRLTQRATIEAGKVTMLDFPFSMRSILEGQVLIKGQACTEAYMTLAIESPERKEEIETVTGRDGSYRIEATHGGAGSLSITASGQDDSVSFKKRLLLDIPDGQTLHYDIELASDSVVFGTVARPATVTDSAVYLLPGEVPLPKVTEQITESFYEVIMDLDEFIVVQTEQNGTFRIEGVGPGVYTVVGVGTEADTNPEDATQDPPFAVFELDGLTVSLRNSQDKPEPQVYYDVVTTTVPEKGEVRVDLTLH